jgi:hypothetical protein
VENATSTTKIPSMRIFYKDMTTNTVAYAGDLLLNQKTQKFFARMVYDKKTEGDDIKFYAGGNASSFINITLHLTHNTTISSPLYEGNITTMWGMSKGRFNSLGSTQSYPEDREVIITTYTFDKILKPIITDVSHNKENAIILSPGKWIIQDPYSGSMSDKVKITLFSTSPSPREEIIYPPNEYKLTVGESVALGGKKLTLDNVGADGGVMVTLKESTFIPPKPAVVIPENKLVVQVKDYKYDKSSAINRWAILKITAG